MTKALRVAVLTSILALTAAPVFADPGGSDPPPPPSNSATTSTAVAAFLVALGL
ncbi:MAG TPA: hypothetical protein VL990_15005 [Acidobacteriaceae bacterium]|nr:hypothetical protein [Acidobacteriaceae bacterium]